MLARSVPSAGFIGLVEALVGAAWFLALFSDAVGLLDVGDREGAEGFFFPRVLVLVGPFAAVFVFAPAGLVVDLVFFVAF